MKALPVASNDIGTGTRQPGPAFALLASAQAITFQHSPRVGSQVAGGGAGYRELECPGEAGGVGGDVGPGAVGNAGGPLHDDVRAVAGGEANLEGDGIG